MAAGTVARPHAFATWFPLIVTVASNRANKPRPARKARGWFFVPPSSRVVLMMAAPVYFC